MSSSPVDTRGTRLRAALRELHADGRGWTLLVVAVGWFFVLGLRFVIPALLPLITDDFPVSNAAAGGAITLLWVTYAFIQFPAGALVDRVGERRLLVASALVSAAGLAGYLGSVTFAVFLLATAAFGFGSGLYGPARGTVLTRTFPDRDGIAFGTVLAAGSVGAAVLPPLTTVLAGRIGWRAAIGLTVPAFLVVAVALWRRVPAGTADDPVQADGDAGPEDRRPETDGGDALRADLAAIRTAVASKGVALAVAAVTCMLFALQGLTAFLTTYLVEVKGLGEGTAGLLFGVVFVSGAIAQWLGGGLADRWGHGRVLALVSFLSVPPLIALPLLSGVLPLALVAATLGVRLSVGPVTNAYVVGLLPLEIRGTAWGFLRTGFFTVGAFGSTVVGAMADRALFAEAFFLLAALSALAGLLYLFLPARGGIRT